MTSFGVAAEQVDTLMDEVEAAIAAAEADMGAEIIDAGGWVEIVRSIVSFSPFSVEVKNEVLRMQGLEPDGQIMGPEFPRSFDD